MSELGHPTSDVPPDGTTGHPHELLDSTVARVDRRDLSEPMLGFEHDLEAVSWLVCSPQLDGEVTGHLCDALVAWALAGRGYPQMAPPDASSASDHLQALKAIIDRIPQRILAADGVALKMDLGRFGRLLMRAFRASWDPQGVRDNAERELVAAGRRVIGMRAPCRPPGGGET